MSLSGKVEFEQEINTPGDFFFKAYGKKRKYLPRVCPDKVPSIELLEGKYGDVGCTLSVQYSIDGKTVTTKEILEAIDNDNMTMTYNIVEGDFLKVYKSLRIVIKVTPKGDKNLVNWTYEYEKQNADVPAPDHMFDFARELTNNIDAYCVQNKLHAKA